MIQRLNEMRCVCGKEIEDDLLLLDECLCKECYEASMEAAYRGLPDIFDEGLNQCQ